MSRYCLGIFLALMLSTDLVLAKDVMSYGVSGVFAQLKSVEPEADTDSETFIIPQIDFSYQTSRINRYSASARYLDLDFAAIPDHISANVTGLQFRGQWEYRARLSRRFRPWLGLGISSNVLKHKGREFVDADGFLKGDLLEDREESTMSVLLSIANEWKVDRRWTVGLNLSYEISLSDSIEGVSSGIGIKKRFGL
ncbi:MAG: autotransporter outer membrane beta-barrel domain-containing protein [Gammaproteobacteria bacterium]|nr:autotransporter outer membrane beta-barrel domain-containing protein [Gammaproteobacteria bacterium]